MRKDVNPAVFVAVLVVVVGAVVLYFLRATGAEGVKTDKPPKPHPPGGIPMAIGDSQATGAPAAPLPPPPGSRVSPGGGAPASPLPAPE